jgi:hypothetical protein
MSKTPIVFFGSGPVAAKSLELLLTDFEIVAIVTKPKPSHHRGNFPVIDCAKQHKLPLHTVSNKKDLFIYDKTNPSNMYTIADFFDSNGEIKNYTYNIINPDGYIGKGNSGFTINNNNSLQFINL